MNLPLPCPPDLPAEDLERLQREFATYRRELLGLLGQGQTGRYALIRENQVVGVWDTQAQASHEGRNRFGLEPITVKRIDPRDVERIAALGARGGRMPILNRVLTTEGALVDLVVGWSSQDAQQQRAALRPIPPSAAMRAILDTGAEVTCLDATVIQQLGLPVEGVTITNVPAAGGLTYGMQYKACLTVVHSSGNPLDNLQLDGLVVVELPLGPLGYQALLGRDVLALCDFLYRGKGGTFTLSY